MALLIGEPIHARELERETSGWSPERFATMCDALAWAISGREHPRFPTFTTRVNAADGGVDAEWDLELQEDDRSVPTPILASGWNVFQYKKRDLLAQDRRRIISGLKSSLRGAVDQVVRDRGRHPQRYVLFANIDFKHDDKLALKERILEGYGESSSVSVEIVGAAELAALLNDQPHLRAAFFAPLNFRTWAEGMRAHRELKLFGASVDLVGREEELAELSMWVDDPRIRVILLSGPHDIGKSRLALEATKHHPHNTVIALDPRSMSHSDYRALCSPHNQVICIVEDPAEDDLRSLIDEALTWGSLKLLVTLPTAANAPAPSYGRDDRVRTFCLKPLAGESARALLRTAGAILDYGVEEWVISNAGGIPGVLLVAAKLGMDLRRETANFAETVGQEYERRIRETLGEDALTCATLFSVLEYVGVAGGVEAELEAICRRFGDGWTMHHALNRLPDLEMAGVAMRRGSYVTMSLPLLANHLVGQLLVARLPNLFALFADLSEQGQLRLIKRLAGVGKTHAEIFWKELFEPEGPLGNVNRALDHSHVLRFAAGAVPELTLRMLETGFQASSREDLLAIEGERRRDLLWSLEQLLFRSKTSKGALRLVGLLAEAKNEHYGSNATGVFVESFHPLHLQMPSSFFERLAVIQEFAGSTLNERRLLAIKAIENAFNRHGAVMLRESTSFEPLDPMYAGTMEEARTYLRKLIELRFSLAEETDDEIAKAAIGELPHVVAEFGIQVSPQEAVTYFEKFVGWARHGNPYVDVSLLFSALGSFCEDLSERLAKSEVPDELAEQYQMALERIPQLKSALGEASFALRLRRFAGRWSRDLEAEESEPDGRFRFEVELERLSQEAVEEPGLLSQELAKWLLCPAAQRASSFFFHLGLYDKGGTFRSRVEEMGRLPEGTSAFSAYWGGWSTRDRTAAEERLDSLATTNDVTGTALVAATCYLEAGLGGVQRLMNQIKAMRVDPQYVASMVQVWVDGLSKDEFLLLLQSIAGPEFEHGSSAIRLIHRWIRGKRPIQDDLAAFAWECMTHNSILISPNDAWYFDQVAAKLSEQNPEQGFLLLKSLLMKSGENRNLWEPLGPPIRTAFWKTLHAKDRNRLLHTILDVCLESPLARVRVSWRMCEILDQTADEEVLKSLAAEHVDHARIIAGWLTSAKPGFWPLVFHLHEMYPEDEGLHVKLLGGIHQKGPGFQGPLHAFYQHRKAEVEEKLADSNTPPSIRSWLREVRDRLDQEIQSFVVWEYDHEINDLRQYIQDEKSDQRIWAIGRVLKYGQWEDIRRLLNVEDIEEALPQLDLPERKRKMLERALLVWRRGN